MNNGANRSNSADESDHPPVRLTIVVPAFDEEALVSETVEHLLDMVPCRIHEVEIIIVNDGSSDGTRGIADALATRYPPVKAVHLSRNGGFGHAVRAGFTHATKRYVTVCPADYKLTRTDLDSYLALMGHADIVIGYRRERRRNLHFFPWLVSAGYHFLINVLFGLNFYDTNWIHMYRREQLGQFLGQSDGVFFLAESLIQAKRLGLNIVGVDVNFSERMSYSPEIGQ